MYIPSVVVILNEIIMNVILGEVAAAVGIAPASGISLCNNPPYPAIIDMNMIHFDIG